MSFNGKVPQEAHILFIKQQTSFAHLFKNNNKKTNEPCFRSYLIRFQKWWSQRRAPFSTYRQSHLAAETGSSHLSLLFPNSHLSTLRFQALSSSSLSPRALRRLSSPPTGDDRRRCVPVGCGQTAC